MLKRLAILTTLCVVFVSPAFSQKVIDYQVEVEGNIQLTEEISIPKVNSGYTLWIPDSGNIMGLIVFTHSRRDTSYNNGIIHLALSHQLAIMYTTTDNRLEFLFKKEKIEELLGYIDTVISVHHIPKDNILYCGMSLEGTRALQLAIYGHDSATKYPIVPRAIAICDAPLDMIRFHSSMVKAKKLNFQPDAANEGAWVSDYLENNLGGPPMQVMSAYLDYSPFSYHEGKDNNLQAFRNTSIRAYTEPDVNWWIETRRKDYYSMNATDMAAWINALKISGHQQAELITTNNKGFRPDGSRHPHSWSIVDEKELVEWFVKLIK